VAKRVQRGGSFLCCDNYCVRFKVGGRGKGGPESTGNPIGFRWVRSANDPGGPRRAVRNKTTEGAFP
jgi:hypothetical protein